MNKINKIVNIINRKARFDYEICDIYTAGIVLTGTEIKSIRLSKAGLTDSYCSFEGNELWVRNMHIATYKFGTFYNHDAKRNRKLLLTKRELRKLARQTLQTGYTIVPLSLYVNDKGFAKLEIALARGKRDYDKRQTLRQNEDKRNMDRVMKVYK